MAKTPFLIRHDITFSHTGATIAQNSLDLGSYTNLGSSKPEVLRIHKIDFMVTNAATGDLPTILANTTASVNWQMTTQDNGTGALVLASDDSFVAGASLSYRNTDGAGARQPSQGIEQNLLPQEYLDGYVIAVPNLFFTGFVDADFAEDVTVSFVLQCSTESMSKSSAVSLAISQQ